jgi:hypothetical protein
MYNPGAPNLANLGIKIEITNLYHHLTLFIYKWTSLKFLKKKNRVFCPGFSVKNQ